MQIEEQSNVSENQSTSSVSMITTFWIVQNRFSLFVFLLQHFFEANLFAQLNLTELTWHDIFDIFGAENFSRKQLGSKVSEAFRTGFTPEYSYLFNRNTSQLFLFKLNIHLLISIIYSM